MSALLVGTLPFAIGAAISPTVLAIVVLILASGTRAVHRTWLFALGGAALTAAFILLCRTVFAQVSGSSDGPSGIDRIIEGVLAAALIALAIRVIVKKPADPAKGKGRVQRILESGNPWAYIGLGAAAMAANGSTLILVLAGSHHITITEAPLDAKIVASVLLFIGACLPLVLPPLLATIGGQHAEGFLHRLNVFTTKHQKVINAAILLLIAALLAWKALTP